MNVRTALAQEARGLESIFASRRPYETAVRHARWTEGPINLIGAGPARLAGLAGAWLLEWLLGWPAAARSVAAFRHYSIPMLRPRSLLIVISPSGAGEETIEAVRLAQKHGARVLAMSRDPASPLAQMATDLFLLPGEDEAPPQIATPFLEHAAMVYVGLAASSTFNPRHPVVDDMEEFQQLPNHLEWIVTHLDEVIRSLVPRLKSAERVLITGAGLYHTAALQAAGLAAQLGIFHVQAIELPDLLDKAGGDVGREDTVLLLSGSSCRMKKMAHALASGLKEKRIPVFSITDSNDADLVRCSEMAVLLPALSEITGPLLHLAFLQWLIAEAREGGR